MTQALAKRTRGQMAYHSGQAAEKAVADHYRARGYLVSHVRWRGTAGEIDLILRRNDSIVFVEVKQSKRTETLASRVSRRQMRRLLNTASEFLAQSPQGLLTPSRFDVALVDGVGHIEVIENAIMDV